MRPRKEIQKKRRHDGEGSLRRNEPSHSLASWFNNPQAFETFITKWEKRKFVTPRYITYDFIVEHNYRNLTRIIEQQGFGTLVNMTNAYYPDLVSACTSHLKYSASNEGGYVECYVAGRYRVIPLDAIANLCGLSMEGHRFMGGIHAHESWGPYALQRGRESKAIGYGPVWTRIFEYLTIGLDGYQKVEIGEDNCINERTLKKMRRQLEQQGQGVDEVEEEVDRMEQEDQGHQQPQAQATMLDLVQEMRRMNENLQAFQIETRGQYQSMNTRIGRVERSVRAIHDHLGIHYDEDEDED
ncbi:hypothetical protein PIB30_057470 [Stylosanthes scabra]|uniref:Uncharacterized protein n=1 Tax=Stylosanthes scabra TaxID=79078 RepID=A0ABU6QJ54_9FABA|nr:hypothetical protein [Stylosanthes scabra]